MNRILLIALTMLAACDETRRVTPPDATPVVVPVIDQRPDGLAPPDEPPDAAPDAAADAAPDAAADGSPQN